MLRFLTDEEFDGRITRGLLAREPALDLVRVQDSGLMGINDATVLAWAAANGRVVLSHDRNTMTDAAILRINAGDPMAGLVIVDRRMSIGLAIDEILILNGCTEMLEWTSRIEYLPMC